MRLTPATVLLLVLAAPAALAKPASNGAMPTKRPADREVGERLWQQSCWQCHGERGKGDGPAAGALVGGVPSLEGKILGEAFEPQVQVVEDGRGRMPAYAEDIDKHDARRILLYIRDVMEGRVEPGKAKDAEKADEKAEGDANPN